MPMNAAKLLLLKVLGGGAAFSPLDISGLALWLDASDASTLFQASNGTTPATADTDVVGYWGDKSGNGRHVTQGTTANKPLLKLAQQNGLNTVLFDGSDDFLSYAGVAAAVDTFTAFYVIRPTGLVANRRIAFSIGTGTNGISFSSSGNTAGRIGLLFSAVAWADTTTAYSSGQPYIVSVVRTGGITTMRANGAQLSPTFNSVPVTATTSTAVGKQLTANVVMSGDICELILYSTALSTSDIQTVSAYLDTKWAVY